MPKKKRNASRLFVAFRHPPPSMSIFGSEGNVTGHIFIDEEGIRRGRQRHSPNLEQSFACLDESRQVDRSRRHYQGFGHQIRAKIRKSPRRNVIISIQDVVEKILREVVEGQEKILGNDHSDILYHSTGWSM